MVPFVAWLRSTDRFCGKSTILRSASYDEGAQVKQPIPGRDERASNPPTSKGQAILLASVRLSSALFAGAVLYAVATKLANDDFTHDWAHTVVHVLFAVAGLGVLRLASAHAARGYSLTVVGVYGLLLWVGLQWGGMFEGMPMAIPLATADNVFHAGLTGLALAALAADRWLGR